MTNRILPVLPALLLLSACGSEPESESVDSGKAAGEVLGGTISDDMIALEQLTSQSPPEDPRPAASGETGSQGSDDGEETSAAPPSEPASAPESDPADPGEE